LTENRVNLVEEAEELRMELAPDTDVEFLAQRSLKGKLGLFFLYFAAFVSVFHIYHLVFRPMDPLMFRSYHLLLLGIMGFVFFPGWARAKAKVHWSDYMGIAALVYVFFYIYSHFDRVQLLFGTGRVTRMDVIVALIGVVLVLELARRACGNALPLLALVFFIYPFIGQYMPGILNAPAYTPSRVITYMWTTNGVFSAPIAISARYIVLFIIFSSFLTVSGVGAYFVKFAFTISGFARGGPAKVAVIASALMGMMNGTSVGNVVTTGSLSIPLMKRVGYSPTFAAATEAVASTGGQIMPPIMGAGVFIMSEITRIR